MAFILSDVSYSSCNGVPARACSLSPLNPQRRSKEQVPNSVLFVLMRIPITATMGSERTANRLFIALFFEMNSSAGKVKNIMRAFHYIRQAGILFER